MCRSQTKSFNFRPLPLPATPIPRVPHWSDRYVVSVQPGLVYRLNNFQLVNTGREVHGAHSTDAPVVADTQADVSVVARWNRLEEKPGNFFLRYRRGKSVKPELFRHFVTVPVR